MNKEDIKNIIKDRIQKYKNIINELYTNTSEFGFNPLIPSYMSKVYELEDLLKEIETKEHR